jgi:predicted ATP-binding protein involved in virulence
MRIERIELKNFRGFASRTLELAPSFNVLIGDNGTGKTAILDALAIGAGALFLGLDGASPPGIHRFDVRQITRRLGQTLTLEAAYPAAITCQGLVDGQSLQWNRTLEGPSRHTTHGGASGLAALADSWSGKVRAGEPITLPLLSYYGTGRLWLQRRERRSTATEGARLLRPGSRFRGYRGCLDPTSDLKGFVSWFKTMELIQLQRRAKLGTLAAVKQAISRCLRGWDEVFYDFRLGDLVARNKKTQLRFEMLSDGVRNILAMVGDIAYRAATLNPHLKEKAPSLTPGIVLIDELDLHLHPLWQREVVDDLRGVFPAMQFVATTHSPFIIQALRKNELINLDDRSRETLPSRSIEDIAEEVMGVQIPSAATGTRR